MKRLTEHLDTSLIWMVAGVLVFIGGFILAAMTQSYFAFFFFLVIGGLVCAVGVRKRSDWEKSRRN